MKKIFGLFIVALMAVNFIGCASDGMAVNTTSGNRVDRYFQQGTIQLQRKVVIDDRELAVLTGAGIGAVGGAVASGDVKGGLIGGAIGGVLGAVVGNEVVAYKTTVKSNDKDYTCYLKQKLPLGTIVEFTVVDNKLKNVDVVSTPKS